MIFSRSLHRELAYTAGAVFIVLLSIMLAAMMIRIIGVAAIGNADPSNLTLLISLQIIRYLSIILIATLYIAITIVLTRWQRDSEINIWLSSGASLIDFLKSLMTFSGPLIVLVGVFSLIGWPWANKKQSELFEKFKQSDDIAFLTPGQFRESSLAKRVFFVEQVNLEDKKLLNIFTAKIKENGFEVIVASNGSIETSHNGDRYLILSNGSLYDKNSKNTSMKTAHFQKYALRIANPVFTKNTSVKNQSTLTLFKNPNKVKNGELSWRIGLILMGIILVITAVPIALHHSRNKGSFNFILAVLIFFTYSNLLSLIKAKISQGTLGLFMGLITLHGSAALIAIMCLIQSFDHRQHFIPFLKRVGVSLYFLSKKKQGKNEDL